MVMYITTGGFKALKDEFEYLKSVERPKVVNEVAEAAAQGDRSENAEYIYGKRRLREIDRRMRFLNKNFADMQGLPNPDQYIEQNLSGERLAVIVTNPPYGERIKIEDLNAMYEQLGDTFKKKYGENCEVWLITSDFEAMKHIGLKPSKKIPLLNGQLDCRFLKFELYEGSKKAKKQEAEESDE